MSKSFKDKPLVSIIVITYNSSNYVLETLESAKNQTYNNIELIITDDASIDNTVEICSGWLNNNKERFVKTELITTSENTGIPSNCNRGVKASNGEWVKLIAGDDVLLNTCIQDNVIEVSSNKHIKVLFSKILMYRENILKSSYVRELPHPSEIKLFKKNISANDQYNMLLYGDLIGVTASSFIKHNVFESVNYYDEKYKKMEDYPFWLKLTKNGYKLHYMNKATVNYRLHSNNTFIGENINLFHPSFVHREDFRREYIYPHINKLNYIDYKQRYYVSKIFLILDMNKKSYINSKIYSLFTYRLNILRLLSKIKNT